MKKKKKKKDKNNEITCQHLKCNNMADCFDLMIYKPL